MKEKILVFIGGIKLRLHSFRRHCKSVIATQTNTDYSEWFLGHLHSPYWTLKEAERRETYKVDVCLHLRS